MQEIDLRPTSRRNFLGALATTTAALSVTSIAAPLSAGAKTFSQNLHKDDDPEEWFKQLKGKHKMVFDVTQPHEVLPFAWPRVFLMTNEATGTVEKDTNAVVVLRHSAIPYAMENRLWEKYKFGEAFKINDHLTNAAAIRNPFWQPKAGDFKVPGIGNVAIGINELQKSGVLFCVCDVALTVNSAGMAQGMNADAAAIKKDWVSGLLPGIQVVPSGVWAIGRAQEHGCAYCFAG
ncbi:MAG TPA: twin-arginine translocation signal domain-containing protein [Chitinophagaceae bacterium]|jgi:intracellular sulfur oxidation DsrE/DsrF family protein|nr:twin-arginine translocation signal domain-containing protein [Chitinophagaceae bacterium]